MSNEKYKTLEDINDILIVQKIREKELSGEASNNLPEAKECLCFETECDCEEYQLVEDQKAIIKKQLQLLQADERGKQALTAEIAALKQSQEQKAALIRNRLRAREIENNRAKKIASLPPPLTKTVKELLKKYDEEPKAEKPDVEMPEELSAVKVNLSESRRENKENILNPEELEIRKKMEEERQMKAKKRFHEALKKDRLKEEYSNVMKQIQTAELQNRQEMAKNITSEKKGVPCPLSDKFQASKKQADMEESTEKLFKKTSMREHIIEDIEGYEDLYEEKYKRIDSNYESRMIDCIPSFVKENYDYLLGDETKFEGGKNFSGLDDSGSDILNQAYIETPPGDELDGKKKIDLAISHLDKLRSDIETEYEQTLKPLLTAMEPPKKNVKDKAVETDSTKLLAKDKAVETDMKFNYDLTSPSPPPPNLDVKNAGVMAFKRRPRGPMLNFYRRIIPDMHNRDVHYTVPSATHSDGLTPGSWSSSSYCSLPSKDGVHSLHSSVEHEKCDICVAEKNASSDLTDEHAPKIADSAKQSDKSTNCNNKVIFSEYVRQIAEKYLTGKSSSSVHSGNEGITKVVSDSLYSKMENVGPAFEKETICKSKSDLFDEQKAAKDSGSVSTTEKENSPTKKGNIYQNDVPESLLHFAKKSGVTKNEENIMTSNSDSISIEHEIHQDDRQRDHFKDNIYSEIQNYESSKSPDEYSDYDLEAKRIQAIHQVLSRRFPRFSTTLSPKSSSQKNLKNEKEPDCFSLSTENEIVVKPHVYHELSTIQELDSALTGGSLHLSESKISDTKDIKPAEDSPEKSATDLSPSSDGMKMVSLLDPPDSKIAELAKNIHFTTETKKNDLQHSDGSKPVFSEPSNLTSISYKNSMSMTSHVTGSSSSSSASSGKVFSSTLTGNHAKHCNGKDRKLLPDFNVSEIGQTNLDSKKTNACSLTPSSEFISNYSSPVSSSSQSLPSVIDKKSNKKDDGPSLLSGYISNLEVPEMTKSETGYPLQEKKVIVPSIVSGYISDITDSGLNTSGISQPAQDEKDLLSIASGYIRDIETPNESNSGRNLEIISSLKHRHIIVQSSESDGSLKPMSIHSNVSSPNELVILTPKYTDQGSSSSSSESFKALSLHSNVSTPSELAVCAKKAHQGSDIFKALTPHSNISSPRELATVVHKNESKGFANSSESFKMLSVHSNVSSPSELAATSKNKHQDSEIFNALTPHSNISTPSNLMVCIPKYEHQKNSSSSGDSKDLTPQAEITTPSFPYVGTELRRKMFSSESSEFQPITLRLDILTSALSSSSSNSQLSDPKNISQLSYNFALKTHLSKSSKMLLPNESEQKKITVSPTGEKEANHKSVRNNEENIKNKLVALQKAHACSSDFFVPHIKDSKVISGKCDSNSIASKPNQQYLFEKKNSGTESISSNEEILASDVKGEATFGKSKKFLQNPDVYHFKGHIKQYSNLQAISSTSSSAENLSEISESKVLFQSTPIKNISEIIKEPGILEETNLTLHATQMSCKIDSLVRDRDPLTPLLEEQSLIEESKQITPSQSECKTPENQSPKHLSGDTPSMISFLQHELSCLQSENTVQFMGDSNNAPSGISDCKPEELRGVRRFQLPRSGYKERTKRLWKNLEEVKKKHANEEKKLEMQRNRLRAKEYAQKITPKRK